MIAPIRLLSCSVRNEPAVFKLARMIHERFLLQSPIRYCDKPPASGLAPRTLNVLHEYASGPHGSARRSRDAAQRFRYDPS